MKIITWNIHGAASFGWNNQYEIKSKLVDKIVEQRADIVVLTEFVIAKGYDYLFECFKNEDYIWFQQSRSGSNGILIAIKSSYIDENNKYYNGAITSQINDCNLLSVTLRMKDGEIITIIGCRFETQIEAKKKTQKDYDEQRKSFDKILIGAIDQSKESDICIVCGDFNNAKCRGDLSKKFDKSNYIDKSDHKEYIQCNYNLNIIKDTFDDKDFTMADIDINGRNPIPTYKGLPLDHIFVRGLKPVKSGTIPNDDLSDHEMLWATFFVW